MGYIGNQTSNSYTSLAKQTITGDGGASYTLDHAVANEQEIEVFVNNVRQEPSVAYTVSGTALTMTGNVESSDDFYVVFQGKAIQTTTHPEGQDLKARDGTFSGDVTADGNLGIGTTSPTFNSGSGVEISRSGTSTLRVERTGATASAGEFFAGNDKVVLATTTNTDLLFRTNDTERMRIDTSGNVGIGTASPVSNLHIKGSSAGQADMRFTDTATGQTSTDGLVMGVDSGANAYLWNYENETLYFGTNNAQRMTIQSGGGVSIGQTDGNGKLNIQSSGLLNRWHNDGGTSGYFTIASIRNNAGSGEVGSIVRVNDASTAYNTSSDHRLKENVEDMTGAITRVKNLQPKRFNFISDTTDTLVDGFMAHEAATVVPEAVTGTHNAVDDDGNPVYQGIDQSKLVPLLTGALQEAIAKIEALETRVQALEDA